MSQDLKEVQIELPSQRQTLNYNIKGAKFHTNLKNVPIMRFQDQIQTYRKISPSLMHKWGFF
jgi:hypothetical protein